MWRFLRRSGAPNIPIRPGVVSSGSTGILRSLRIRTLKNKGFEGPQTLVIEGSTPSKQGPRILRADEQFG